MRSSRRGAGPPGGLAACAVAIGLSALVLARVRPRLLERFDSLRVTSDTYALPAPDQVIVASLGYRSALADLLFARVLVSYGLHFQEKRRFEFVGSYLDTINALDPGFRAPYYIADTLLTLQAVPPRRQDYEKAREILERGMEQLPYDSRLWLQAGQFLAYLGPAAFDDPEQKRQWRLAGARRLARACEMLPEDENTPFQCIVAAGTLSREGEVEAMIQFLERVLAVSDNEQIRALALAMLEKKGSERDRMRVERRHQAFREVWASDLRFVAKDTLLVLGPPLDTGRCAGQLIPTHECATSWRAWAQSRE